MGKVSIIVAYYNEELYIKESIESLINQTYKDIEIILVNDGSVDKSLYICKEYALKDNRIKNYTIANSGVSTARNIGLEKVTGQYIMFVDGDDWIEKNMVEFTLNELKKTKSDILISSYFQNLRKIEKKVPLISNEDKAFNNSGEKKELYMKSIYARYTEKDTEEAGLVSVGTVMCKLYKSDIIQSNNIKFDPKLIRSEDVVFALEAFKHAKKIQYINKSMYHYRMGVDSACAPKNYIINADEKYGLLLERLNEFQSLFTNKEDFYNVYYARTIQALLWHIKHKYFHKGHTENILKMRKQVVDIIKKEPFKTALIEVDEKLLPKQEKIMVKLFKRRLILFYYIFQKIIERRDEGDVNKS